MPRRKTNADNNTHKPLIRIERTSYEKAAFKLSTTLLSSLSQYAVYVKEVTGDEASPDEIVEKGMQRLFDADRGFRQWRQRKEAQSLKTSREEWVRVPETVGSAAGNPA